MIKTIFCGLKLCKRQFRQRNETGRENNGKVENNFNYPFKPLAIDPRFNLNTGLCACTYVCDFLCTRLCVKLLDVGELDPYFAYCNNLSVVCLTGT